MAGETTRSLSVTPRLVNWAMASAPITTWTWLPPRRASSSPTALAASPPLGSLQSTRMSRRWGMGASGRGDPQTLYTGFGKHARFRGREHEGTRQGRGAGTGPSILLIWLPAYYSQSLGIPAPSDTLPRASRLAPSRLV